jgi:hypothetical protein
VANSSLLTLFQTTLQGMGVASYGNPASVIGNTNADVTQTLALFNIAGDEIAHEREWQAMTKQIIFTATFFQYTGTTVNNVAQIAGLSSVASLDSTFMVTGIGIPQDCFVTSIVGNTANLNQVATVNQSGALFTFSKVQFAPPSDFDRLVDRTMWDKSKHWEQLGPKTAQEWEWLKSGYISTGPRIRWRMLDNYFTIWPPLGSTDVLSYEYVSKNWILGAADYTPTKAAFTLDTDTCFMPDALSRAVIKLKYFTIKGFDTTAAMRDYQTQLDIFKAYDAGSAMLSMAPRRSEVLLGWENIPDSNYGS